MDYYLDFDNCYERLKREYQQHNDLVIAVDFDDTVYDCHKMSRTYDDVLTLLRRAQKYCKIYAWTGHFEEDYDRIRQYFLDNGVNLTGINEDTCISVGRKMYANIYLDDRGGLPTTYALLKKLIDEIEAQ